MTDTLVLGFDTSAAQCAAALVSGDRVLAAAREPMARGQAERLLPMLEAVLADAGAAWGDLAGIGVCTGPGNFTGVRLSVAAARGLALGLGVPAVGVTRFEALAAGVPGEVLVTIAAPQGRLYAQLMRDGAPAAAAIVAPAAEAVVAPAGACCIGDAADIIAGRLGLALGAASAVPDAASVARLAAGRLAASARPVPVYLLAPDATPSAEPVPVIFDP